MTPIRHTPFRTALVHALRAYIISAKRDGTTAMGLECLAQCVRSPSQSLQGAPLGTNARYYYMELFREICATEPVIRKFICF